MELPELEQRLGPFLRVHLHPAARVTNVELAGGHAGFAYLFDAGVDGTVHRYWMRLPPPDVKLEGTADVLRQVTVLKALDGTDVPHAPVAWSGDDPQWFGRPYFVTPRLEGDVLRTDEGTWGTTLPQATREDMARQAMTALVGVHRLDWRAKCAYLRDFWGFEFDVTRWDRFYEKAAAPERLALQPLVREKLLARIPTNAHIGVYHGDFQWANLMFSAPPECRLLAVIDWELTGIGATLNDLGWICTFNDPRAWTHRPVGLMPGADALEAMYREAWGVELGDVAWFKALAAYKFSIISGFNLMLHRRGKRHDPHWEEVSLSMAGLMAYAAELLS